MAAPGFRSDSQVPNGPESSRRLRELKRSRTRRSLVMVEGERVPNEPSFMTPPPKRSKHRRRQHHRVAQEEKEVDTTILQLNSNAALHGEEDENGSNVETHGALLDNASADDAGEPVPERKD